jgi:hypothetical protein
MLWLDEYERSARLAPGLIALLPLPILVTAFGLKQNPIIAILVSLLVAVGGPLVLAKFVRSNGRALERNLYQAWGGPPTTLLLTPKDPNDSNAILTQRRSNVEKITGQALPTSPGPNDEDAQAVYAAAVAVLRQRTYDHKAYPLIFSENKSYGFERNVLAIRVQGICLACAGFIASAIGGGLAASHEFNASSTALISAAVVFIPLNIFWIFWPTKKRVRDAANLYAQQLLDAAVTLKKI